MTLEGNALKKAHYVAMVTGLPSLADDTGLEVSALNGAPGVYSARYAGEQASYDDNVEKLLSEMVDIGGGTDVITRGLKFPLMNTLQQKQLIKLL